MNPTTATQAFQSSPANPTQQQLENPNPATTMSPIKPNPQPSSDFQSPCKGIRPQDIYDSVVTPNRSGAAQALFELFAKAKTSEAGALPASVARHQQALGSIERVIKPSSKPGFQISASGLNLAPQLQVPSVPLDMDKHSITATALPATVTAPAAEHPIVPSGGGKMCIRCFSTETKWWHKDRASGQPLCSQCALTAHTTKTRNRDPRPGSASAASSVEEKVKKQTVRTQPARKQPVRQQQQQQQQKQAVVKKRKAAPLPPAVKTLVYDELCQVLAAALLTNCYVDAFYLTFGLQVATAEEAFLAIGSASALPQAKKRILQLLQDHVFAAKFSGITGQSLYPVLWPQEAMARVRLLDRPPAKLSPKASLTLNTAVPKWAIPTVAVGEVKKGVPAIAWGGTGGGSNEVKEVAHFAVFNPVIGQPTPETHKEKYCQILAAAILTRNYHIHYMPPVPASPTNNSPAYTAYCSIAAYLADAKPRVLQLLLDPVFCYKYADQTGQFLYPALFEGEAKRRVAVLKFAPLTVPTTNQRSRAIVS